MRIVSSIRLGVLAASVLVATACDRIVGPGSDIAGTYVLASVNGDNLPAVEHENVYERQEFVAGTITLLEEGDWTASTTYRVTNRSNGRSRTELAAGQGIFSYNGSSIRLSPSMTARIYADRLELSAPVDFPDRVLTYRRVRYER